MRQPFVLDCLEGMCVVNSVNKFSSREWNRVSYRNKTLR